MFTVKQPQSNSNKMILCTIFVQMEDAIYGNNNPSFGHFTAPAIISLLVNLYGKINN